MRRHKPRKGLPQRTDKHLRAEAAIVGKARNPANRAASRWKEARRSKWFGVVVATLKDMAGVGDPCMYCDSNEAAEVDHFKPMCAFPENAFEWNNLLWVCGICNRFKGGRFPPDTQPGAEILNPLEVDPWKHFFMDELTGLLAGVWDEAMQSNDSRAESTIAIIELNRESLQERRRQRINEIKQFVRDAVTRLDASSVTVNDVERQIVELKDAPLQPDVAEYFLIGPGSEIEPFKSLLKKIECEAK
jgi:uncharacterized protein (TIGR02646 family)